MAMTISSLVLNWRYTAAFVTPISSAIICNDVPLTPCSAISFNAASSTRVWAAVRVISLNLRPSCVDVTATRVAEH